jgi:hypothetical protein
MLNTKEKFNSGYVSVGDRFSEMFSHWKVIVDVKENGEIVAIEGNSYELDIIVYQNFDEFKYKCSYKTIEGYWIDFIDNSKNRVKDFIESYYVLREKSAKEQDIKNWEKILQRNKAIDKLVFNI